MVEPVTISDLAGHVRTLLSTVRAAEKVARDIGLSAARESISSAEAKRQLDELRMTAAGEISARLEEVGYALRVWSRPR